MRQKELRIALVCYGGVSLAIYMHGVTRELWQLARASRAFHAASGPLQGVEAVYRQLIERIEDEPAARLKWRFSKMWAQPFANWLLSRPGSDITDAVAPETRAEVERKVSHLIRGRWFEPPFSGLGFSRLLERAFSAMAEGPIDEPLLPPGHPLDLYVTRLRGPRDRQFPGRVPPAAGRGNRPAVRPNRTELARKGGFPQARHACPCCAGNA